VIGLETLPEWGNNLGLYYTTNFVFTYPTIVGYMEQEMNGSEKHIFDGHSIDSHQITMYDSAFSLHNYGYSFTQDIEYTMTHHPEKICFYSRDGEILGFLAYDKDIYPFLWGNVFPVFQDQIFRDLYTAIHGRMCHNKLLIRMNTRYHIIHNLLHLGFHIERVTVRMLLKGYEGDFLHVANDDSAVFRAWVA
jgi:hypothetical protein